MSDPDNQAEVEDVPASCRRCVLATTFALIGWQILTRPEVWGAEGTAGMSQ